MSEKDSPLQVQLKALLSQVETVQGQVAQMGTAVQSLIASESVAPAAGVVFHAASTVGAFGLSLVATTSIVTAAGDDIILTIGHYAYDGASPTFAIADSGGATFVQDASVLTGGKQVVIASALGVGAGTHNITVTASTGNPSNSVGAVQALRFTGIAAFDKSATAFNTNTSPATGNTTTLAKTGSVAIAAFASDSTGSGYTSPPTGGPGVYTNTATGALDIVFNGDFDYQLNVGTAAVSASWGTLVAAPWAAAVAVYKPTGTSPPPASVQYPRAMNFSLNGAAFPNGAGAVNNITYGTHMDMFVLVDDEEGAALGNGYNRGTVTNAILAGDGVVVPKVTQYVLDSYFDPATQNFVPTWGAQMNAMSSTWFLYNPFPGTHVFTTDPPPTTNYAYNPCNNGPGSLDANGNNCEAAFCRFCDQLYVSGTTGVSNNAADAAASLSGFWHDNTDASAWNFVGAGNWLGGTTYYNSNDVTAQTVARAGLAQFFQWATANSAAKFNVGNVNYLGDLNDAPGVPIYTRAPSVNTSLYGLLNAAEVESAYGPASTEHFNGFDTMRQLVQYVDGSVTHPEYNQYAYEGLNGTGNDTDFPVGSVGPGTGGVNGTTGQGARYSICTSLCIGQGGISPQSSGQITSNTPGGFYDYWSVNVSTLVAVDYNTQQASIGSGRRWLGVPLDAVQTAPSVVAGFSPTGKCYARRYTMPNGRTALVLGNPSSNSNAGAAPVTLTLATGFGGTWSKITASAGNNDANATVNSGATGLTSIIIPVGDGIILVQ